MRKHKTFSGGYRFINFEGQPKDILEEIKVPLMVAIPLRQGFGGEGDCLVKAGEGVLAGQIIGHSEYGVSSPVHSSVNGVVEEVKRVNYFKRDCLMVLIKGDGNPRYQKLPGAINNWESLASEEIEKILYLSGVTALDREGIPTRMRSSIILPKEAKSLIVHGVGSEPYNISPELLLKGKNILNLIEGIKILRKIMPNARVFLALSSHSRKILEEIEKLTSAYDWLELYPL